MVGIIGGCGWMGRAIGEAMLRTGFVDPTSIILSTRSAPAADFARRSEIEITSDNRKLVERADVIVVSIRPQHFAGLQVDARGKLVISVMASISVETLQQKIGSRRIIRAMPNAAAEIGRSYTPWFATAEVTNNDKRFAQTLFETCGVADEVLSEAQIDYLTGLTGSGPAFPALLADAMLSHALSRGLPASIAARAVKSILCDATRLMMPDNVSARTIVERFLSYSGTTAAGLKKMTASGFVGAVHAGLDAAATVAVAK